MSRPQTITPPRPMARTRCTPSSSPSATRRTRRASSSTSWPGMASKPWPTSGGSPAHGNTHTSTGTTSPRPLPPAGVEYRWFEALGGRRKGSGDSPRNLGLRNESFRHYADYMATPEFHEAVGELLALARRKRTAYMCSEGLYWRCHRRLVSDYLLAQGITVQHIMPDGELRPHTLTEGARIDGGGLSYPPPEGDQMPSLFD